FTRPNRVECGVDRLEAGATQAVHGLAGHLDREAGKEGRHPRHVAVVLARLVRTAEARIVDQRRVDPGAVDEGAERRRRQIVRAYRGQRTAVPADRGAHRIDDPSFHHQPRSTHTLLTWVYRSRAYCPSSRP